MDAYSKAEARWRLFRKGPLCTVKEFNKAGYKFMAGVLVLTLPGGTFGLNLLHEGRIWLGTFIFLGSFALGWGWACWIGRRYYKREQRQRRHDWLRFQRRYPFEAAILEYL